MGIESFDRPASEASSPAYDETDVSYKTFRYLADPICILSLVLYVLNRWVLKPHHIGGWLVAGYFNDIICLPLFLPMILWLQAILGIRRHSLPPTLFELVHNWLIFSILFELVLPHLSSFESVADPWDVGAYFVGGWAAYVFWNRAR